MRDRVVRILVKDWLGELVKVLQRQLCGVIRRNEEAGHSEDGTMVGGRIKLDCAVF